MRQPDAICALDVLEPVFFALAGRARRPAAGISLLRCYTFHPNDPAFKQLTAGVAAQHMLMDLQAFGIRVEIRS